MIINKNYRDLEECEFMDGYQINHSISSDDDLVVDLDAPLYIGGCVHVKGNLSANVSIETECGSCILVDGDANVDELCGEDVVLKVGGNLTATDIDCIGVIVGGNAKIAEFLKCACAVVHENATIDTINCAENIVVCGDVHANKIWCVFDEEDEFDGNNNVESIIVGGNIDCPSVFAEAIFENDEDIDDAIEGRIAEIEDWDIDYYD